jgi:hypothetical protein
VESAAEKPGQRAEEAAGTPEAGAADGAAGKRLSRGEEM